jgi:hypothetical protein
MQGVLDGNGKYGKHAALLNKEVLTPVLTAAQQNLWDAPEDAAAQVFVDALHSLHDTFQQTSPEYFAGKNNTMPRCPVDAPCALAPPVPHLTTLAFSSSSWRFRCSLSLLSWWHLLPTFTPPLVCSLHCSTTLQRWRTTKNRKRRK